MPVCKFFNSLGMELRSVTTELFFGTITVGRSADCTVCLGGNVDNSVSRLQLEFKKVKGNWSVFNVGRAHLFLNGEKIKECELHNGDTFRFSNIFMTIGAQSGPSPFELSWNFPTENNQHRAVLWPGVNTLGSSHENYQAILTKDLSRIHGKITVVGKKMFYEKMAESCAAEVNGVSIDKDSVELKEGDELFLGEESEIHIEKRLLQNTTSLTKKVNLQQNVSGRIAATVIIILLSVLIFLAILTWFTDILL